MEQHPGRILEHRYIIPSGLTQGRFAERVGILRATIARLVNENSDMTPRVALLLEQAGYGTADEWGRLQWAYDLAKERTKRNE